MNDGDGPLDVLRYIVSSGLVDVFCNVAKVRENKRSHVTVSDLRHYNITYSLLLANFNFNYKSNFPMMKM